MCEANRKAVIEFLSKDTFFKELFDSELSDAKFKPLRLLGLDTLEKLLSLSSKDALKISYIGRKTYRALRELQEQYNAVVNEISNSKALQFKDFKWVLKRDQRIVEAAGSMGAGAPIECSHADRAWERAEFRVGHAVAERSWEKERSGSALDRGQPGPKFRKEFS